MLRRHNGMHLFHISTSKSGPTLVLFVHFDLEMCFAPQRRAIFIPHLTRCLRTRRFGVPTFSTLRSHKSLEKHCESQLFYFFRAPASAFFRLFLFSDLLSSSLTLPAFPSVHIVGSLTSKLPSATIFLSLPV